MQLVIAQIQAIANNINRLLGKVQITNGTYDVDVTSGGLLKVDAAFSAPPTVAVNDLKPDGTNQMPAMDVAARAGCQKIHGYNGTNWHEVRLDTTTRATNTIDYAHHEIHAGSHFFVKRWFDITGGGTVRNFLIVTPNTTKWGHFLLNIETEDEFTVAFYEGGTTAANGSALTVFNSDRNSAIAATIGIYDTPTITADGTLLLDGKVGSGSGTPGESKHDDELKLKQNTKYL
jgi:hypothetical protein